MVSGSLVVFGVLLVAADAVAGALATLGAGLLAAEVVLRRPTLPLALAGLMAIGASWVLAPTQHALVLGLFYLAALTLPLARSWAGGMALALGLCLTYAAAFVAVELAGAPELPWWHLGLNVLGFNVAAAISHELALGRRRAERSARELDASLAQQLLFAQDLQRALREARALRQAIVAVRAEQDAGSVLRRVSSEVRRLTQADGVGVLLPTASDEGPAMVAGASAEGHPLPDNLALSTGPGTVLGEAVARRESVWLADAVGAQMAPGEPGRAVGGRSLGFVPILVSGTVYGVLAVAWSRERHEFSLGERELLEALAEQAGVALELAALRAELAARAEGAEVAYARLRSADRQREEFLALVSHELRQPVAAIGVTAEVLAETPGLGPAEQRALEHLRHQARSLARLAEEVLAVARLESGQFQLRPTMVDLGALVAGLVREASEPERVGLQLPPEPVLVEADPERLGEAVDNLVRNALKYSPPGTPVGVEVGGSTSEAWVVVRDQGVGLEPSELAQLFQKYGRVRNDRTARVSGVGLGLYLSRLLVEAHGGRVEAASPGPGQGATFTLRLPLRMPVGSRQ